MLEQTVIPTGTPFTRSRAERLVTEAGKYEASILIRHENRTINGKSMLGLLSLGRITDAVRLICDGPDEKQAAAALSDLMEGK